jgi:hypothetical protein
MTEDITRGLTLLAEEVEPAAIDSHAVVATVKARKRNRRAVATAFASVAVIGAITMTLSTDRAPDTATTGESPSTRLTTQLTAALPDVIPAEWRTVPAPIYGPPNGPPPPPLLFSCMSETPHRTVPDSDLPEVFSPRNLVPSSPNDAAERDVCQATAWYQDAQGPIELWLEVEYPGRWFSPVCPPDECDEWALPSGTRVRVNVETVGVPTPGHLQWFEVLQPNGTYVRVTTHWQNDRSTPPLTLDELLRFADRFSY